MDLLSRIRTTFSAPTGSYAATRTVRKLGRWTLVDDTITNRTAEPLACKISHDLATGKAWARVCGRADQPYWGDPANPTLFYDGLGVIFLDDASRVHVVSHITGRIEDNHRVIPANSSTIYQWAVTDADDYWDFADSARSLIGGNRRLDGPPAWMRFGTGWTAKQLRTYQQQTGCAYLILPPTKVNGRDAHGPELLNQNLSALSAEMRARQDALPDVKHLVYFDCGWVGSRALMQDYPQHRQENADGSIVYLDNGQNWPVMVPVAGSTYADKVQQILDSWLAAVPYNGVYLDLSECPYRTRPYHYDPPADQMPSKLPWDGCSGDIGPDGKLQRLKSSVTLLTQDFRTTMVRNLQARGLTVIANMAPWTQGSSNLQVPRFVECSRVEDYPAAHLYGCQAYLARSFANENDAAAEAIEALENGCLPIDPNDIAFTRTRPTIGSAFYPIDPVIVRPGLIAGANRRVDDVNSVSFRP